MLETEEICFPSPRLLMGRMGMSVWFCFFDYLFFMFVCYMFVYCRLLPCGGVRLLWGVSGTGLEGMRGWGGGVKGLERGRGGGCEEGTVPVR